jgi:hypothetical protein
MAAFPHVGFRPALFGYSVYNLGDHPTRFGLRRARNKERHRVPHEQIIMTRQACFWWGAFGSLLPEILRFFKLVAAGDPLPHLNWPIYLGFLVLFVGSSGVFSIAWKAENEFKAVWVGASVPVLVATLIQTTPGLPGH